MAEQQYIPGYVGTNVIDSTNNRTVLNNTLKTWQFYSGLAEDQTTTLVTVADDVDYYVTGLSIYVRCTSGSGADSYIQIPNIGQLLKCTVPAPDAVTGAIPHEMATLSFPEPLLLKSKAKIQVVSGGAGCKAVASVAGYTVPRDNLTNS